MNKKVFLSIYYAGLIGGSILINYMLTHQAETGQAIIEAFQSMDKLKYIDGQELFLYILLKRGKQVGIACFVYFQISRLFTLLLSDLYYALIEGMFLSLCTYYYGIAGAMGGAVMLLPQFLCFLLLQLLGWKLYENKENSEKIPARKWAAFVLILIIIATIIELTINIWFGTRFFVNK